MDLKKISFLLALLLTFELSRGEGIDERVKKEINKWSAKTYRSQTDFFKILGNQVEEVSCESDGDCREGKKCVSAKWQEGKKSCRYLSVLFLEIFLKQNFPGASPGRARSTRTATLATSAWRTRS